VRSIHARVTEELGRDDKHRLFRLNVNNKGVTTEASYLCVQAGELGCAPLQAGVEATKPWNVWMIDIMIDRPAAAELLDSNK
jgi:hypothetical protein